MYSKAKGRWVMLGLGILALTGAVHRTRGESPGGTPNSVYEVYAISYGIIPDFPLSELVAGADASRKMDIQMIIWLLKGPGGRNILVDSGFYRAKFFKHWNLKDYVKPSEAIGKVGLKPEQITDLIITHMHWDHVDGVDLFPKARVWIQKDEFNHYSDLANQVHGVDPEDMAVLSRVDQEGRLTLVDGDAQSLIPGLTFYTGGRHTYASQYVGVHARSGTVVIASDNVYLYENLEKHRPIAATWDAASNLKAQDRMKTLASQPRLIIPGHDPAVFERFPKPGNGVARIE
jgi:glyoxylase-like metal-dependent hydrolase (beta-lactamase superfamily II)